MKRKETIVEQLEQTILNKEREIEKTDSYLALNRANELYNKLLADGVTTKRGFTLRGIEDSHLFKVKLNV